LAQDSIECKQPFDIFQPFLVIGFSRLGAAREDTRRHGAGEPMRAEE